jgi:rubrerythrin
MSEENSEKKEPRIINVVLTEEIKNLMREKTLLEERLKEKETLGLELFELKKAEAIRAYPAMKTTLQACNTPETLERFIDSAHEEQVKNYENHGTANPENRQTPAGKSTMYNPRSGEETFESSTQMIDSLYDKAYYHSSQFTKEQVADAKKKIETLIESMVSGKSWSELKQRGKTSELMKHEISSCSACGATQIDNYEGKCSQCGFNPKEKGPRQTRHYKPPETRGA